jgi:hypothetical protein
MHFNHKNRSKKSSKTFSRKAIRKATNIEKLSEVYKSNSERQPFRCIKVYQSNSERPPLQKVGRLYNRDDSSSDDNYDISKDPLLKTCYFWIVQK